MNSKGTNRGGAPGNGPGPNSPKTKKNVDMSRWLTGCVLYIVIICIVSLILSYLAITMANDMFGLVKPKDTVSIVVEQGDKVKDIASELEEKGVIQYKSLFTLYATFKKFDESKIQSGVYEVEKNMPYSTLLSKVKKPIVQKERETVTVTIPEGYELWQIVDLLDEKGVCSKEDLMDTIQNYKFKHEFLKDLPERNNRLEGYLFPDTYQFYAEDKSISVINKMLNNFDDKFDYEFYDRAKEIGMTLDEVITLASIIEREAASDEERGAVSAVFHNRLESKEYPYLQSCASVQYILKERKTVLSIEDTKIDNPYNTYINKGLPPGPISSPGLASIRAALYPDEVDYLFFVAYPDGATLFATTYDQHLANVKKAELAREKR
jgi:UPF0755 protein